MGILSTSAAIQCFGGYGYCDDFPVEQHFRDMRIHPIHEGTTGIQAMDLLGRKLVMDNGRALSLLKEEIMDALAQARQIDIGALSENLRGGLPADRPPRVLANDLTKALARVEKTATILGGVAMEKGPEAFLADAALFLEMFGHLVIAWQWLTMATAAAKALNGKKLKKKQIRFLQGKCHVAAYFYAYELPKIHSLALTLELSGQLTCDVPDTVFTD